MGVESARVASEVFGYDVLLTRSLKHSADTGSIDLTQLSAAISAVVEAKPDVLLLSLRQREWDHALKQLSAARPESLRGVATPIAGGHTFMGVWFQGASQQANGVDCMGSGDACSYVTGGTQMSKDESLNAYKDGLLDKTYSWLRTESGYMVGFDNSSLVSFPDGAMIPSFLAQALQQVFRFRPLTNRERPLADATDYELFRSFLASGEKVADTFYGPVRFDEFGQNSGRKPTTLQVSPDGVAQEVYPVAIAKKGFDFPAPSWPGVTCPADAWNLSYGSACLLCAPNTCQATDHRVGCIDGPPSSDYYSFTHTGCDGTTGPAVSFVWAFDALDESCNWLPAHGTLQQCSWAHPWAAWHVVILVVLSSLPLILLSFAAIRFRERFRQVVVATGDAQRQYTLLAYLIASLGALIHSVATPLAFIDSNTGNATEGMCIARTVVSFLAPAVVFLGITLRILAEAKAREGKPGRLAKYAGVQSSIEPTTTAKAFAAAQLFMFCAMVGSSAAVLSSVTGGPATIATNLTKEIGLDEESRTVEVALTVQMCCSIREFSWQSRVALLVPLLAMFLLSFVGHLSRGMHPSSGTLMLNLLITLLVVQFPTLDVFSTRAPIGLVIGWAALCSEVVHPVYKRWNQQSDDREWRIFDHGAPLEMPNPRRSGEQGWHLFLSHKWSTAQDQVQSLCPQLKLLVPSLKVWRMFKRPLALRPPKLRLGGPACRPQSRGLQSGSWSV